MQCIELTVDGRRADLVLNRPERRNAITPLMLSEIRDALAGLEGIDVLVLTARGPDWSVGFDLDHFPEGSTEGAVLGGEVVSALLDLDAITVAVLHGWVVGGGAVIAAACDFRVASPNTTIRIPEVPLGIPLGWGALPLLVADLGPSVTKDLVMTGRDMPAEEALSRGFVSRLAPDLGAASEALVRQLLGTSPKALRTTKRQVSAAAAIARTAEVDAELLLEAVADPAFAAVLANYLEKVRPGATALPDTAAAPDAAD